MTEFRILFASLLAFAALGCGGSVEVTGKVSYEGKPVVFGTVTLVGADGQTTYCQIQPDGTFRFPDAKPGPAKVYVSSPRPPGVVSQADNPEERRSATPTTLTVNPEVVKSWYPLPEKFGNPSLSDIIVEIERGKPLIIDLK